MVKALLDIQPLLPALASGHLIITANDRLRRHLLKAWAEHQRQQGLEAWVTPAVYPLNRWLEDRWQGLLEAGHLGCDRAIAERHQRQLIWEQVIGAFDEGQALLQPEPLAQQADAALRSLTLWQVNPEQLAQSPFPHSNTQSFLSWLEAFERRLDSRQLTTPEAAQTRLLDAFQQGQLPVHPQIWLLGFDDLPPLHRQILEAASEQQVYVQAGSAEHTDLARVLAPDTETEVRSAALWSQQQLEHDPNAAIGIIVPDLGQRRDQVERLFAEVFEPGAPHPDRPRYTFPFNFSAGVPLGSTPLIDSALQLLTLNRDQWPLASICQLLSSPFWSLPEPEWVLRTQLAERLRRLGKFEITGSDLRYHAQRLTERLAPEGDAEPGDAALARRLQLLDEQRRRLPRSLTARRWSQVFHAQLEALGWPGTRRLDSQEYQQMGQWHQLLATFATLEATGADLSLSQALKRLNQLAGQTPFQAQTPDSPVQILGALEGAGLRFTHCWVLGLHQRQWPPVPAPNPLLPIELQRELQMPHASAERELQFARSLTANYRQCAEQVIFSCASADEQGDLSVSPLIRAIAPSPLESVIEQDQSATQKHLDRLAEHRQLEAVHCARGPSVDTEQKAPGGSGLFKHQAACPFNAFAQLRLGAREPDLPALGLSPAERGTLLHNALASLWEQLNNSEHLQALPENELETLIARHCQDALQPIRQRRPRELGPEYCALELARLHQLIGRWLALEKQRSPFKVMATEQRRDIELSGLKLTLFIDRIDELNNGELLLIDYKTGADLSPAQWLGDRPDEPQLPLYAVSQPDSQDTAIQGIAFAQLHPKALQWIGLGALSSAPLGVKPPPGDWQEQLGDWDRVLTRLAEDFVAGDARVDYKDSKAMRYSEALLPLNRALETDAVQRFLTGGSQ